MTSFENQEGKAPEETSKIQLSTVVRAVANDLDKSKSNKEMRDFASATIAISDIKERIEMVENFQEEFKKLVMRREEIYHLAKQDLKSCSLEDIETAAEQAVDEARNEAYDMKLSRIEYQEYINRIRIEIQTEVKVLKRALRYFQRHDKKIQKHLTSYVNAQKSALATAVTRHDHLYAKHREQLNACETLDAVYKLVASVESSYETKEALATFQQEVAAKIKELSQKVASVITRPEKKQKIVANSVKTESRYSIFASDDSMEQITPLLTELFEKALTSPLSPIVHESTNAKDYLLISCGNCLYKFNKHNTDEYCVFLSSVPIIRDGVIIAMPKEIEEFFPKLESALELI